jgi:deoxyadenosine/deoxycytidine kinase
MANLKAEGKIERKDILIGIVGPCAAGKTTLVAGLNDYGYQARGIAQEHSFAPSMWQRITKPDVLIYLDVSYENTIRRRQLDWTPGEYTEQLHRLRHARQYADFYLDTNPLTISEVLARVIDFLERTKKKWSNA